MTPQRSRALRSRRRLAPLVAIVAPALALAVAAWLRRWTTDDAFINYRVVDQLLAGNGPVFNAGERVEAYSSPLWLALLAVGQLVLPTRIEHTAIVLSIPLTVIGIIAMGVASQRLLAPQVVVDLDGDDGRGTLVPGRTWWLPAGTLVLVALPPMWDFATAGLETALTLAWVGLLALALARATGAPDHPPTWTLVVAGLGPLVRPDCAIPAGVVLLVITHRTWRASGGRRALGGLAIAAAIPVAYQLFRMAYFAALVPNTALAKQASVPHWTEGWAYVTDFVGPYALLLPLVVLGLAAVAVVTDLPRDRRLVVAALPVAGLLQAAFIVRAGGDYAHARLLLPPLFCLLAPVALLPVSGGSPAAARRRIPTGAVAAIAIVLLVAWSATTAGFLRKGEPTLVGRSLIADGRQAVVGSLGVDHPVTAEQQGWGKGSPAVQRIRAEAITVGARPLDATPLPTLRTPTVAMHGVGVSGFSLGPEVHVIDLLGLGDALTSRLRVDRPGFIGHEKPLPPAWLAARLSPDPLDPAELGHAGIATPLHESSEAAFPVDVAAAARALDCPALQELRAAITGDLTWGRAWSNLWASPSTTRLTIDPDPEAAARTLC